MDNDKPMTKKEMKVAKKAKKFESSENAKKQNKVKWGIIGISSIVFLSLFGLLIFFVKQNNQKAVEPSSIESVEISENTGWVRGSDDSKVTLVEFGDFQCPACRAFHPVVKELLASYEEGQIKFIFKHFPLTSIHPNAMIAALAAEAAGNQGKFFEYHDMLYDMQDRWEGLIAADVDVKFIEFAQDLELDIEQFNADRKDPGTEAKIRANMDEGTNSGVTSTPTFFVNGEKIDNPQNISDFRKIVDNELE